MAEELTAEQIACVALAAALGCERPLEAAKAAFAMTGDNGEAPTEEGLERLMDAMRRLAEDDRANREGVRPHFGPTGRAV